jgi:predicted RNA-binding Zn ribbon-like protein
VGKELLSSLADGVFFVDLSALSDASLVVPAIAHALPLRETPGRSLAKNLADHLSSREMLLILDNFEQVIEAAPEISSLVTGAPRVKVLVTSREALRIQGERVVSLSPLGVPSPEQDDVEEVARSRAVARALERGRRELLELRTAIREVLASVAAGDPPSRRAVDRLNHVSRSAPTWSELDPVNLVLRDRSSARGIDALLASYARSAMDLLANDASRLRRCPAPSCGMFYVSTRPQQRWCSTQCGTRARVARHYSSHRNEYVSESSGDT